MTTTTSTGINIEAFHALSREDKAIRWRTYSYETRFELCRETLKRMDRAHTSDQVEAAVAHWDAKFAAGAAPVASESTPAYTTITHRIEHDKLTRDYACYIQINNDPEQYIGSETTHHAAELKCCDYKNDLSDRLLGLDSRPTPRCGDCEAAQADTGRCEDCDDRAAAISISEPEPCAGLQEDCKYFRVTVDGTVYRLHNEWSYGIDIQEQRLGLPDIWVGRDLEEDFPTTLPAAARARVRALWDQLFMSGRPSLSFSIRQPPRCACGQAATISNLYGLYGEPAGLFCGPCYEAAELSTERDGDADRRVPLGQDRRQPRRADRAGDVAQTARRRSGTALLPGDDAC